MSEGASSAPDAAVRLSMKRSSDSSHSESETKRLHTDHSMRDVVKLLDDSDVGRSIERCREVCRRSKMFLVDVNDWDCAFRDKLRTCGSDGTTVACSSIGTIRELMSNESCLLDLLAAARNGNGGLERKTIGKCARQHIRGILGAVGHCEEFDPVLVHRAKMDEKDFIDKMGVYDVVPRSAAAEKGCRVIRTIWVTVNKGFDDAPQLRARWFAQEFRGRYGDKHEYFSETPDLALVKAVIAHAARRAEIEDIVVAVFDVRRAYFHEEEKRDTFVELPDYVPAEFRTTHVGKLGKALYGKRPAAASWRDELRKGLVSCDLTVGTVSRCCFHNKLRSVAGMVHGDDIFVAVRVRMYQKWWQHSRRDGRLAVRCQIQAW